MLVSGIGVKAFGIKEVSKLHSLSFGCSARLCMQGPKTCIFRLALSLFYIRGGRQIHLPIVLPIVLVYVCTEVLDVANDFPSFACLLLD